MSGRLRGNWRGTKKSYMISYRPYEHNETKTYTCALSEEFTTQAAITADTTCRNHCGFCALLSKEISNSGAALWELPGDAYFVR